MPETFLTEEEEKAATGFLATGHVVLPVDDVDGLSRIRYTVSMLAANYLGHETPSDPGSFLDRLGDHVDTVGLNELRLAVFNGINAEPWLRPTYFGLARSALTILVGNELAMQRRINLSIQLPNDDSSLLPVHADVWSGDSPFEVVVWLPLVDCRASKSMYLLTPARNAEIQENMKAFAGKSAEDLFKEIENDVEFLSIPFGNVMLFSQNLLHGNRVNREPDTRWSMNCRFKSVFSPYADKKLGEFFEPVTLRPASRMGLEYELPRDFKSDEPDA